MDVVPTSLAVIHALSRPDGRHLVDLVGHGVAEVAEAVAALAIQWWSADVAVTRRGAGVATVLTRHPAAVSARIVAFAESDWSDAIVHIDADQGLAGVRLDGSPFALVTLGGLSPPLPDQGEQLRLVTLALQAADAIEATKTLRRDLGALEGVATNILSLRDLDQALLSTTNEILDVLDADMAGVLLLDGEELAMRCCVGNQSIENGAPSNGSGSRRRRPRDRDRSALQGRQVSRERAHHPRLRPARRAPSGLVARWLRRWSSMASRSACWRCGVDAEPRSPMPMSLNWSRSRTSLRIAIDNARLYDQAQHSLTRLAAAEATLTKRSPRCSTRRKST